MQRYRMQQLLEGHQVCGAWSRSTSPPPTEGHVPEPQEERATLRLHFSPASGTGFIALPWLWSRAGFGGEVTAVARLPEAPMGRPKGSTTTAEELRANLGETSFRRRIATTTSTTRTGGWSTSSSRLPITEGCACRDGSCRPRASSETALESVGGSDGAPSSVSSLNRKPCHWALPYVVGWGRTASRRGPENPREGANGRPF